MASLPRAAAWHLGGSPWHPGRAPEPLPLGAGGGRWSGRFQGARRENTRNLGSRRFPLSAWKAVLGARSSGCQLKGSPGQHPPFRPRGAEIVYVRVILVWRGRTDKKDKSWKRVGSQPPAGGRSSCRTRSSVGIPPPSGVSRHFGWDTVPFSEKHSEVTGERQGWRELA